MRWALVWQQSLYQGFRMGKLTVGKIVGGVTSGIIILSFLVGLYLVFSPVDVLENWSLRVKEETYETGQDIVGTSEFTKIRAVTGIAKRYIECKNAEGRFNNRILISEGRADRPPEIRGTDVYLKIPQTIPNLPVRCRIAITVEYEIYSFRKHLETNISNEFNVKQAERSEAPEPISQENDSFVVESAPKKNGNASVNSNREVVPAPTVESTPENPEESPVVPPNTSIICRLPVVTWVIINPILGVC